MRRLAVVSVALGCCLAAGCHQKTVTNDGLVVSYQWWVPTLVALGGLALVPVGVLIFRAGRYVGGVALCIVGPSLMLGLAPTMLMDKVVVNSDGFYSAHGFWWSQTTHAVRYKDLSLVRVTVEERSGRRGKTYSYFFDCSMKSGGTERVPLGDTMKEALPDILGQFRANAVRVEVPPNLP